MALGGEVMGVSDTLPSWNCARQTHTDIEQNHVCTEYTGIIMKYIMIESFF